MSNKTKDLMREMVEKSSSFTVEKSGVNEMPQVSKLLNRKSFSKSRTSFKKNETKTGITLNLDVPSKVDIETGIQPGGRSEAVAIQAAPVETVTSLNPIDLTYPTPLEISNPTPSAPLPTEMKIQTASRRKSQKTPLLAWNLAQIQTLSDPMAQALAKLISAGVKQALFLAIQPVTGDSKAVFVANAAVNAGNKTDLWTGLRWEASIFPDVWHQLISEGFVELPEPGTMTSFQSARNVARAAFDTGPDEFLTIARVGTPKQWRGLLVLVSQKSIVGSMKPLMPLLSTLPESMKKAA